MTRIEISRHTVKHEKHERQETQGGSRKVNESLRGKVLVDQVELDFLREVGDALATHAQEQRSVNFPDYKTPLWTFVRQLKAIPKLSRLTPEDAFTEVTLALKSLKQWEDETVWIEAFSGFDSLGQLGNLYDIEAEFINCWESVKFVPGEDILASAVRLAKEKPLLGESTAQDAYFIFLNLAAHMQRLVGDQNIFLGCEAVAKQLHVAPLTVSRYRNRARREGYLELVRPHVFSKRGLSRATEFRFLYLGGRGAEPSA